MSAAALTRDYAYMRSGLRFLRETWTKGRQLWNPVASYKPNLAF